jgi:hypothetical protein
MLFPMKSLLLIPLFFLSACAPATEVEQTARQNPGERCVIGSTDECFCANADGTLAAQECEIGQCPPCS